MELKLEQQILHIKSVIKMNQKTNMYATTGTFSTAALYLAMSGCTGDEHIRRMIQQEVPPIFQREIIPLEKRVKGLETLPLSQGFIRVNKEKNPGEYQRLKGVLAPKYNDQEKSRKDAEANSTDIYVGPTGTRGMYRALIVRKVAKDNPFIVEDVDIIYTDIVAGKEIRRYFGLTERELSQAMREQLINVRPFVSPPTTPKPQKRENRQPFIRPPNFRRQYRLPVKR